MSGHSQIKDTENNGIRTVTSDFVTDGDVRYTGVWSYSVNASKSNMMGTNYSTGIVITGVSKDLLPEKPGILIRFFGDNNILKLKSENVSDLPHKDCAVLLVVPIAESQLEMFKKGLKKIRVEMIEDYVEHEYEQDVCGASIYEAYKNVKKQMSTPRKSFADGF